MQLNPGERIQAALLVQRPFCVVAGFQLAENEVLLKGDKSSRELSAHYFKRLDDFGFEVHYDSHGKPWPKDLPGHVSISHSKTWLFLSFSETCPQGIDVEETRPQLDKIASRILHPEEIAWLNGVKERQAALQLFWGAKEALYKAYGRKKLDFRTELRIEPFDPKNPSTFEGRVLHDDSVWAYRLEWLQPDENTWLVFVVEALDLSH